MNDASCRPRVGLGIYSLMSLINERDGTHVWVHLFLGTIIVSFSQVIPKTWSPWCPGRLIEMLMGETERLPDCVYAQEGRWKLTIYE